MRKIFAHNRSQWCFAAYIMLIGLLALPGFMFSKAANELLQGKSLQATVIGSAKTIGGIPLAIDEADASLYEAAFAAQRRQDWEGADEALAEVKNQILFGDVLAERYLSRKYTPTDAELTAWLANYHNLPQAYDIYQFAVRKGLPHVAEVPKPELITMRGDDNGLAANFDESKHFSTWKNGIEAYRTGKYEAAAQQFDKMLDDRDDLSPWKVSAAGFWSWRAHMALDEKDKAILSLRIAATEPRSFYGILARKQLGEKLGLDAADLTLTPEQIKSLTKYEAVVRATALVQVDKNEVAERELRALYPTLPHDDRYALLALSHQLALPALQIALAKRLETKDDKLDLAKYPIPGWEPVGGFSVDPALIYALVRQESGFRTGAISPAGAMGLMQLMPTTASMMSRSLGASIGMTHASDAERNITLGQSYVRHLLENQLVNNNVIFMLAAYNAGIGRLQEWKNSIDYNNDPLLFIERMPYAETRHYVMQVMTNYWLYNEILGIESPTLAALAENEWPVYVGRG